GRHGEDRLPLLDGGDTAGGEAATVPEAVDLEDGRHVGDARPDEVPVQGVDVLVGVHGPDRGDEGLTGDLAAEGPLQVRADGRTPVEVAVYPLDLEDVL